MIGQTNAWNEGWAKMDEVEANNRRCELAWNAQRCQYTESERTKNMTEADTELLRQKMNIVLVQGNKEIKPLERFEDAGFPKAVEQKLYEAGFKGPSPIQSQAWPIVLSGHDMIGIADTGSGKTLAFLLPVIAHVRSTGTKDPSALILAPTRELVEQIKDQASTFTSFLRVGVAYGGTCRRTQLRNIAAGVQILIACPGRLIDFLESRQVRLQQITYLVLDEADRMLDMGFEPQIRRLVRDMSAERQTVMFSATWPNEVQTLARDLCQRNPVHVAIGCTDLKANCAVTQNVLVMQEHEKRNRIIQLVAELVQADADQRILIFTETKRGSDILTGELRQNGFKALAIHGDKEQRERTYVLQEFRSGRHPIMVATDVASRGLDIKDVKVVINYDMPSQIEDYVHRIGRTGRAGATGISFAFFTEDKVRLAKPLIQILHQANQNIPPDLLDLSSKPGNRAGYAPARRYKSYQPAAGFGVPSTGNFYGDAPKKFPPRSHGRQRNPYSPQERFNRGPNRPPPPRGDVPQYQ